jgi:hypothetical protein
MSLQLIALTVADLCCDLAGANKTAGSSGNPQAWPVAEAYYERALKIHAQFNGPQEKRCDISYDLMGVKAMMHKHQESIACATQAMKSKKKVLIGPRYMRALQYLMLNDYKKGFEEFECRWDEDGLHKYTKIEGIPRWSGQKCKSLHVYAEQGFGDQIMMARYLPLIRKHFGVENVCYEVSPSIAGLMLYNLNPLGVNVITSDERKDYPFDYTVQSMSLPHLFGTTFDTVPQFKLKAEPEYIEKWKHLDHKAIAVCWGGRPDAGDFRAQEWNWRRNIKPEMLLPLIGDEHVICIQKDFNPAIETWSDTAGIIANCKYVISVDTGPVHLAAAMMEAKTILLNHHQTCWRWDSLNGKGPWYPNIIQLRQDREHDWTPILAKLKNYVEAWR